MENLLDILIIDIKNNNFKKKINKLLLNSINYKSFILLNS